MRMPSLRSWVAGVALVGAALAWTPAAAQYTQTVGGFVVNLGIVPAAVALRAEGHSEAHPLHPPPGSQHLLVTLDDEKTGKRVDQPDVVIEVTDPRGHVEEKPLLHTHSGGFPDYSELFVFGWPGKYSIRVIITPRPGAKPVEAHFTVDHEL